MGCMTDCEESAEAVDWPGWKCCERSFYYGGDFCEVDLIA